MAKSYIEVERCEGKPGIILDFKIVLTMYFITETYDDPLVVIFKGDERHEFCNYEGVRIYNAYKKYISESEIISTTSHRICYAEISDDITKTKQLINFQKVQTMYTEQDGSLMIIFADHKTHVSSQDQEQVQKLYESYEQYLSKLY